MANKITCKTLNKDDGDASEIISTAPCFNGKLKNKYINVYIKQQQYIQHTYKRGMSDNFTNTMGPFLPVQMILVLSTCAIFKSCPNSTNLYKI